MLWARPWTNLGGNYGVQRSVSTSGMDGEFASCSFTVEIRRVSDGDIVASANVDMTAYTGYW